MYKFFFLCGTSLALNAYGETQSAEKPQSFLNATSTHAEPRPIETPPAGPTTPTDPTPVTTPTHEESEAPVESLDGLARIEGLAQIQSSYESLMADNEKYQEEAESVSKAFQAFQSDAMSLILAMEQYPASSIKRKILLGQLNTRAAKIYNDLVVLNEILPNTEANAAGILAIVEVVDAFRKI